MLKRDGDPTLVGCPGCAGVLSTLTEGQDDFVRYVCQVGHSYSAQALAQAKEDQLEHGMWAVISILGHLEMVYADLLEERRVAGVPIVSADELQARIGQVREYARALRDLLEHDRPPALDSLEGAPGSA